MSLHILSRFAMYPLAVCSFLLLGRVSGVPVQNSTSFSPNDVSSSERQTWCNSQLQVCSTLCHGSFQSSNDNSCNTNTLTTTCRCADGSAPDLSQFTNTVPTFECQYQLAQCRSNATTISEKNACAFQYVCGDRDATQVPGASTTSSSMSSSRTATSTRTNHGQQGQTTGSSTITSSTYTIQSSSKAWIAGPVIGAVLLIIAIAAIIWYLRRRRARANVTAWKRPDQLDYVTKAELHAESKEPQVSELTGQSRAAELEGGTQRSPVEMHGESRLVELDAT